jgi:hypothetical protein
VHESGPGRLCCKSPKLPSDKILAIRRTNRRPPIYAASVTLPSSPASSSSGNEVPHIFTRKSRLQPGEFLVTSAKRLLQQYRHKREVFPCLLCRRSWSISGRNADIAESTPLTRTRRRRACSSYRQMKAGLRQKPRGCYWTRKLAIGSGQEASPCQSHTDLPAQRR